MYFWITAVLLLFLHYNWEIKQENKWLLNIPITQRSVMWTACGCSWLCLCVAKGLGLKGTPHFYLLDYLCCGGKEKLNREVNRVSLIACWVWARIWVRRKLQKVGFAWSIAVTDFRQKDLKRSRRTRGKKVRHKWLITYQPSAHLKAFSIQRTKGEATEASLAGIY